MPLDVRSLADAITASGQGAAARRGLDLARVARGIDGAGELAFSWRQGRLDGALSNLHAQLESLAPEWATVAQLLPAPWRIELAQPASVSARLADDGFQLQGSGRITLATAGPQLDTTVGATAALDPHGRMRELVVSDGAIDVRDLRVAGMLERGSIKVQGRGAPDAWDGSLALELAGAGAPWPGLEPRGRHRTGRSGRAPGRSPPQPEPARSGHAAARKAELGRRCQHQRAGGRVPPAPDPLLSAELADGRMQWQQHVRASLPTFEVTASAGKSPLRLTAEAAELAFELAGERGRACIAAAWS